MFDETMNEINENEEMEEVTTLVETDYEDSNDEDSDYELTITEENKPDMGLLALAGVGAAALVGGVTFGIIKLVKWGKNRKKNKKRGELHNEVVNMCSAEVSDIEFEEVVEDETENNE